MLQEASKVVFVSGLIVRQGSSLNFPVATLGSLTIKIAIFHPTINGGSQYLEVLDSRSD